MQPHCRIHLQEFWKASLKITLWANLLQLLVKGRTQHRKALPAHILSHQLQMLHLAHRLNIPGLTTMFLLHKAEMGLWHTGMTQQLKSKHLSQQDAYKSNAQL